VAVLDSVERDELVDLIAQAVIDRIDERERVSRLADLVVERVIALQDEEAALGLADANRARK